MDFLNKTVVIIIILDYYVQISDTKKKCTITHTQNYNEKF